MALSKPFPDKPSAVAGIAAVREYAGMGLVTEISVPEDPDRNGVSEAPVRALRGSVFLPPQHFRDGRAVARNHEVIMRWQQPRLGNDFARTGPVLKSRETDFPGRQPAMCHHELVASLAGQGRTPGHWETGGSS